MDGSLSLSASLIKIKLSDICAILGCEYMGEDFLVDGFNSVSYTHLTLPTKLEV